MKEAVEAGFVGFSAPLEGVVRWMYLDVKGLVTTGIGNLIDPMALAFEPEWTMPDGERATRGDIMREWNRVKSNTALARQGHRAAEHVTKLRLSDGGVQQLVSRVLGSMAAQLVRAYPAFEAWPADAQLATLAMAWACGPAFGRTFKALHKALLAADWATASQQCTINATGNAGVIPRNKAMKQLYFMAAALPCDGEELHWPADEQVRQWQAQRGLVPDGLVGPRTIGAL